MKQRYDRNVLIKEIGEAGQKKLLEAKVLIAGAGGLGSTVIANLAGLGVGTLGIVDKDVIEESNLNRQHLHKFANIGMSKAESARRWVEAYNPEIKVVDYNKELTEKNYREIVPPYDIIVDCFDSFESKFCLNKIAVHSMTPLIHGGITEFCGQVTTVIPKETACLHCLFPCPETQTCVPKGVVSPAVATIASIQSMEALKLILNIGKPLTNCLLTFNALEGEFKKSKLKRSLCCPNCSCD